MELFQKKILGDDDPEKLLHTVLFLLGKFFALRSEEEHRNLRFGAESQVQIVGMGAEEKVVYHETFSKSYQGGMRDSKVRPKNSTIGGLYCPVRIIKKYISLVPAGSNSFYCRPHPKFKKGTWYQNSPVGKTL